MKRILFFLLVALVLASCSSNRNAVAGQGRDLNPDEVFTITDDDIARETWKINSTLKGEWKYNGPSVGVSGKNVLAGIAKPIAKSKLKKKLKNAFKKIGLDKARPEFVFNEDGTCRIKLLGASMKGTYNYNPSQEKITIKWHGVPLNANLRRDGKKKLHITFEADKFLSLLSLAGRFTDNSAIKAVSTLLDNYEDVMVGFELKK